MRPLPTPEELRELLDYDPETGLLTWKPRSGTALKSWNLACADKVAGTLRGDGYIAVKIHGVIHPAHRIIWAMTYGEWPECVRHRNRNDADNRLANLYSATRAAMVKERRLSRKAPATFPAADPDGRRYRLESIESPQAVRPELTYEFLGMTRSWRWSRKRLEAALGAGLIVQAGPGQVPRFKRYMDVAAKADSAGERQRDRAGL